jgi:L-lysine exporter family protein LysE/ArgO
MVIILGLFIGFAAAIPLGPVNVFIISQTLKRDHFHGVLAGLTTAALDLVYCLIALIGFSLIKVSVSHFFVSVMKGVAGVIILVVAHHLIRESGTFTLPHNGDKIPSASHRPVLGVIILYVSNPMLYMFWFGIAGMVTGHSLVQHHGWTPYVFAAACGVGSMVWYTSLVRFVSKRQSKIHPEKFRRILMYLGLILTAFGIYTLARIFF